MNAFVVSGLIKRRAELAGDIEKAHEALRKMVLDLGGSSNQRARWRNPRPEALPGANALWAVRTGCDVRCYVQSLPA
jgi:hypothetical protein